MLRVDDIPQQAADDIHLAEPSDDIQCCALMIYQTLFGYKKTQDNRKAILGRIIPLYHPNSEQKLPHGRTSLPQPITGRAVGFYRAKAPLPEYCGATFMRRLRGLHLPPRLLCRRAHYSSPRNEHKYSIINKILCQSYFQKV